MVERGADTLEALRRRVGAAQDATERLVRETAESVAAQSAGYVPPRGWEVPPSGAGATSEVQALVALLETLRGLLPEDLQRQLSELVRQLLVLIRSLIDWWISGIERQSRGGVPEVQDIPIT